MQEASRPYRLMAADAQLAFRTILRKFLVSSGPSIGFFCLYSCMLWYRVICLGYLVFAIGV